MMKDADLDGSQPGPVTAGDLLAALERVHPGTVLLDGVLSLRFFLSDGRCQHVTAQDAEVRIQAVPEDPAPIPPGPFCYATGKVFRMEDGQVAMQTHPCPYFVFLPGQDAFCRFLDTDSRGSPMWDQVKVCGVNDDPTPETEEAERTAMEDFKQLLGSLPDRVIV